MTLLGKCSRLFCENENFELIFSPHLSRRTRDIRQDKHRRIQHIPVVSPLTLVTRLQINILRQLELPLIQSSHNNLIIPHKILLTHSTTQVLRNK